MRARAGGNARIGTTSSPGDGNGLYNGPPVEVAWAGVDNDKMEIGGQHVLLLKDDGSVRCWGDSQRGQCGGLECGGSTPHCIWNEAVTVEDLPPIKQVEASDQTSYYLSVDGEIYCSGLSNNGQCGNGVGDARYSEAHGYNGVHAAVKIDGYPVRPLDFPLQSVSLVLNRALKKLQMDVGRPRPSHCRRAVQLQPHPRAPA